MKEFEGYGPVASWIKDGVDLPSFFRHFKGELNGRFFNHDVPPPMYLQNDRKCEDWKEFLSSTILKRLAEGSMKCLGRVGIDPPPKVVNALSVEPIKPRIILSCKGPNLFTEDAELKLTSLAEIVRHIPKDSYFSSFDDVQGYKQMMLTPRSYQYCGFEFAGYWFCDTTLPFGWKNSAFVYTTTGNLLTQWLESRGIYSALWIDDRFVGAAPPI